MERSVRVTEMSGDLSLVECTESLTKTKTISTETVLRKTLCINISVQRLIFNVDMLSVS